MSQEPFAYVCPANCGCMWRDNKDGSMSLFGKRSQSCEVCEPLPLSELVPLYRGARSGDRRARAGETVKRPEIIAPARLRELADRIESGEVLLWSCGLSRVLPPGRDATDPEIWDCQEMRIVYSGRAIGHLSGTKGPGEKRAGRKSLKR